MDFKIGVKQSKGLRDDKGRRYVDADYFYSIFNFNYDEIVGIKKIKCPGVVYSNGVDRINGGILFTYLDSNGQFKSEEIIAQGDKIIKNIFASPTVIYTGLTPDKKCTFAVLNDKLFISNGTDPILVYDGTYVKEMGAPTAKNNLASGVLSGTYIYAMTYIINSVEVVIGTYSNSVTLNSNSVTLDLPVGIAECTERKIYRTDSGGTQLKLLTTITNNDQIIYVDNITDSSLGANIPPVNGRCPKPKYITVKNEKLLGVGDPLRPNYLYVTQSEIEVFFTTYGVYDVTGVGNDNSEITGMIENYGDIVIFSKKHIYVAEVSGLQAQIRQTDANIGCISGYTVQKAPRNGDFVGGIIFVSSLYDIRVFYGNIQTTLPTSLDNLSTGNLSEQLNKDRFKSELLNSDLDALFFDYKYHLITDSYIYVYDIRIMGWTKYFISTESYQPKYWRFIYCNDCFYISQKNAGILEEMYKDITYRGENLIAEAETPVIIFDEKRCFYKTAQLFFESDGDINGTLLIIIDETRIIEVPISGKGGHFLQDHFNEDHFYVGDNITQYAAIFLNTYGESIRFKLKTDYAGALRGWELNGRVIKP